MLFQRLAYQVGEIQNAPKYPKWLRFRSEGYAVGAAFVFWGLILLFFSSLLFRNDISSPIYFRYVFYPLFIVVVFGFVLAFVLDYMFVKNGLANKRGRFSDETMKRIAFIFVFVPYYLFLFGIVVFLIFCAVSKSQ